MLMESLRFMYNDIFSLIARKEHAFEIQLATKEHPVFKAHFENNPLLPGFIFFEICASVLDHTLTKISKAKFMHPVKPEDILNFVIDTKEKQIRVSVKKEETKVAELVYETI